MASIKPLVRPDYLHKRSQALTDIANQQNEESKPTKWDRIADLYKKVTDLVEVDRSKQGDEILERRISDYAISRGFSIKRFIVPKYGTWIVEEKLCYKGREVDSMKLWEIELLFLEL